jgi:uncharacterized protein HemY
MTYEAETLERVKEQVLSSIEAAAIGPINITKGIDQMVQHKEDRDVTE